MGILNNAPIQEGGSYTASAGANRILVVAGTGESQFTSRPLLGLSFGGVPMVEVVYSGNAETAKGGVYYILEADIPAGANTLTADWGGQVHEAFTGAIYTLGGIDQASPVHSFLTNYGQASTALDLTVPGVDGGVLICGAGTNSVSVSLNATSTVSNSTPALTVDNEQQTTGHEGSAMSAVLSGSQSETVGLRFTASTDPVGAVAVFAPVSAAVLSVSNVGVANAFKAADQDIPVAGTALDTVTSVILQTDGGTYVDDITAGFFASSPTAATIDHDRLLTPLSSATYQLQLIFSDDAIPTPNAVSVNVTIDPATGFQLAELTEAPSLTGTSIWEPYTGPDPVIGEQAVVPLLTTGGADIAVDGKGDASYDYTGIDPVPATDSHSAEYWSSNGTQRVITTATVNISEPDLASPYVTSVSVPAAGTFVPGNNLDLTVNLDEVADVTTTGGTPRIPLTIGAATRYASYVSGTGTAAHLYRYVVQAGDLDEDGIAVGAAVDLNGGVIQDGAGNDLAPALNNIGDTSGVLVDGVGPAITINSITTTDTTPVVSGSAGDAVSLTLVVNAVTYNPAPSGGSWSQQLPELALNDYPMTLDGVDSVGNAAVQRQATLSVVDEIPSTVTSVLRPVLLPILSPVLEVSL